MPKIILNNGDLEINVMLEGEIVKAEVFEPITETWFDCTELIHNRPIIMRQIEIELAHWRDEWQTMLEDAQIKYDKENAG